MQGCSLKCKYCHNRDTWNIQDGFECSAQELVEQIVRYKSYIDNSGGGVTVSGGEPLLQLDFLIELFKKLKKLKIHTALDTAGSISIGPKLEELLSYTDLVLLDIKHIDDGEHKKLTGVTNKNTLNYAKWLSSRGSKMWIRHVLVPGITDVDEHLINLSNFIKTLKTVEKVEVLPYHTMGIVKYKNLGYDYPLGDVSAPTKERVQNAKNILGVDKK